MLRQNTFNFANAQAKEIINRDLPPLDLGVLQRENQQIIDMFLSVDDESIIAIIQQIQKHQDASMGIRSDIFIDMSNQGILPVYFRDAREAKIDANPFHPFAIMGLQSFRAARKLAELANLPDKDDRFQLADLASFYERISKNRINDKPEYDLARYLEHCIVPELMDVFSISKEEAFKRLNTARDFCNLDLETQAVATLTEHVDSHVQVVYALQVDVPVVELTDALKLEYQHRQDQAWYQGLQDWQKELVDHYAPQVIQGKVIPTQLRKFFPGLRNAAEEKIAVWNGQDDAEWFDVYHSFHSGNLGHMTKGDNDKLTGLAIDQLKAAVEPAHLHLVSLTSPLTKAAKIDDESALDDQVNLAVERRRNEVTASVIPVNILRHITKETPNTKWMIKSAEKLLKASLNPGSDLLLLSDEAFWTADVASALDPKFRNSYYYRQLIRTVSSLKDARFGTDDKTGGNRHIQIAYEMILLTFYHEQCAKDLKNPGIKPIAVDLFCKSGKDRTGFVDLLATIHAVTNYLAANVNDPAAYEDILKSVVATMTHSQHVQRRAGDVGASLGAQGFVPSLEFALTDRFKEKALHDAILLKAAKYNKKCPTVANNQIGADQRGRLYIELTSARQSLERAVADPTLPNDNMKILAAELVRRAERASTAGKVGIDEAPILSNLLRSATHLLKHQDPASSDYSAELRRFSRHTSQVLGKVSVGKIIGGIALALLGVGIIAASLALGIPSGGVSLGGFVIGAMAIKIGLGLAAGACIFGGTFFAVHGRKKDIALHAEKFLDVAQAKALVI